MTSTIALEVSGRPAIQPWGSQNVSWRPWLFPGAHGDNPLSIAAAQKVCGRAVRAAGLTKRVSMHTLRHSYATHLLEAGTDLLTIQKLLGHKQITSTMIYLHMTHQTTRDALGLMDELCRKLPR